MDLDALKIFVDVARQGSFAEVARRREVDPSSISRAVAALERHLGVRVFERNTRRLVLTEAGGVYAERVGPLIDELVAAGDEARDLSLGPSGRLRVSASVAYGQVALVPRLAAFRAAYPSVSIDLLLTDAQVDLVAERVDVALRLGPQPTSALIVSRLAAVRYRVCASPDYLARVGPPSDPAALAQHDCLLFPFAGFRDRWRFRRAGGGGGAPSGEDEIVVPVSGSVTISSALALRDGAIDGLGVALLADWLVDGAISDGALVDLFPDYEVTATSFDLGVWLVYPSRDYLPSKTRAFIDFLRAGGQTRR